MKKGLRHRDDFLFNEMLRLNEDLMKKGLRLLAHVDHDQTYNSV